MRSGSLVQPALVLAILLAMTVAGLVRHGGTDVDPAFQIETFRTSDDGLIEGALYSGPHESVVILCHGQVFDKESWSELALNFQKAGIDAFAIDFRGYGNSRGPTPGALDLDVLGAVEHLAGRGYDSIGVLGGSMGGRAVLEALARPSAAGVDRVAILAATGPGITSETIDKLFVVSRRDPLYNGVIETFEGSQDPKELKVIEGSAHAQHIFGGPHRGELTDVLIAFFKR